MLTKRNILFYGLISIIILLVINKTFYQQILETKSLEYHKNKELTYSDALIAKAHSDFKNKKISTNLVDVIFLALKQRGAKRKIKFNIDIMAQVNENGATINLVMIGNQMHLQMYSGLGDFSKEVFFIYLLNQSYYLMHPIVGEILEYEVVKHYSTAQIYGTLEPAIINALLKKHVNAFNNDGSLKAMVKKTSNFKELINVCQQFAGSMKAVLAAQVLYLLNVQEKYKRLPRFGASEKNRALIEQVANFIEKPRVKLVKEFEELEKVAQRCLKSQFVDAALTLK